MPEALNCFITGSTFINNIASNDDRALAWNNFNVHYLRLFQISISNSEFTNNIAKKGGALWWNTRSTDIEVNACNFGNNSVHYGRACGVH